MIHDKEDGALSYDEQMDHNADAARYMGMIWEQELRRNQRRREVNAFIWGGLTACACIFLLAWGIVTVTGGSQVCS